MNEFALIFGMMLVTFGVRYPVLALVGRLQLPDSVLRALRYVPVAVLSAIIAPGLVLREGVLTLSYTNAYLVAGIAAVGIAWRTRQLLPTIALGMALFLALRVLFPG
ncbi:MAG: AzlD domain-containing protein [Armatimonadetes bacterium]|nr:AzlD domain-containing protein [Anaerolineae bacterium]